MDLLMAALVVVVSEPHVTDVALERVVPLVQPHMFTQVVFAAYHLKM